MIEVPKFHEYMNPTLKALRDLGGSASIQELYDRVIEDMDLSEEQLEIIHKPELSNQTEVGYRMAWARTYLKKSGLLENSKRAVWALTAAGREVGEVDQLELASQVRDEHRRKKMQELDEDGTEEEVELEQEADEESWRGKLLAALKQMPPDGFERLAQRILRESGFVEVEVTGKSGDGGIDGLGLLRLQDLISFHVLFQCKRWAGAVGAREIRDFRGAIVGRADKGLFITTGNFTKDSKNEAVRDGAPPIDLVDGEQLLDLMKKLGLGVKTQLVEQVAVDEEWIQAI